MRKIGGLICALALLAAFAGPAAATPANDARLDQLFADLHSVTSAEEAKPIESKIWELWMESGDVELDSLMLVGVSAMEVGNLPVALETFDRLVDAAPDFAEAWNKRATVHYLMGNLDLSVADIAQTLTLEPRHFGAWSGLGLIYTALGNEKAALKAFEQAREVNPHIEGLDGLIGQIRVRIEGRGI